MTGVRREHDAGVTLGVVARRTLVVALVAGFVFLAWYLRHTIVLGFATVVVAAILVSSADLVSRVAPLERPWSVAVAGLLILVFIGLVFWLAWPQLQTQSSTLFERLSGAAANLEDRTGVALPGSFPQLAQDTGRGLFSRILSDVARMVQTAASAITGLILVIVAGVFLAVNPRLYRDGFVLLFPPDQHQRAGKALDRTGEALRLWLVGQLLSMAIVGVLIGLGAWAIGLPSPLALGLFAFVTEFIPLVGPFLGAVPALLLATAEGWSALLWTVALFVAVQQLESNLITPTVQREVVNVPPALFMLSVVAMGTLFGVVGVVLAGPLTVTAYVLVRTL